MEKYSKGSMGRVWAFRRTPFHWTCVVLSNIERKMNNVGIFSYDQFTHDITTKHCSSNYRQIVIWADTDIRLIVKITAQDAIKLRYYLKYFQYFKFVFLQLANKMSTESSQQESFGTMF